MPKKTTVYTKEDVFVLQAGVTLYTNSDFKLRYPKRYFQYGEIKYELNKGIIIDFSAAGSSFTTWNVTKLSDGSNQNIYTTNLASELELINLPVFSNSSLNLSLNYDFVYNGRTFSVVNGKINSIQNLNPAKVWIGVDNFNQPIAFYSSNSLYELAIGARLYTDTNLSYFDKSRNFTYEGFEYNFLNGSNMIANAPSEIIYQINQNLTNSNSRLNPSLPDVFYTNRYGTNNNLYSDRQLTTLLFSNLSESQINQIKKDNSSLFDRNGYMDLYYNSGNSIAVQKTDLYNSTIHFQPVTYGYMYDDSLSPLDIMRMGVIENAKILKANLEGKYKETWSQILTPSWHDGAAVERMLQNIYSLIYSLISSGREDLIPPYFGIKYDDFRDRYLSSLNSNGDTPIGKIIINIGLLEVAFEMPYGTVLAEGKIGFGEAGAPVPQPSLGEGMVSSPDGSNAMPLSDYMDQFLENDESSQEIIIGPQGGGQGGGQEGVVITEILKSLYDNSNLYKGSDGNLYNDSSATSKYEGLFIITEPDSSGLIENMTTTVARSLKTNPAFNPNGTVHTVNYLVVPGGGMGGRFYSKQRGMYI